MKRLSASAVDRALACQYWLRPEVDVDDDRPGRGARIGTIVHKMLEGLMHDAPIEPKEGTPGEKRTAKELYTMLEGWVSLVHFEAESPVQTEVPIYTDAVGERGRVLERTEAHRDYGDLREGEIPGTADYVYRRRDGWVIADLKTGRHDPPPPSESGQLLTLALGLSYAYGLEQVTVQFVRPGPTVVSETVTLGTLRAHGDRLRRVPGKISVSTPVSGEHCTYCSAKKVCPLYRDI